MVTIFFTNLPKNIDDGRPYDFLVLNGTNQLVMPMNLTSENLTSYDDTSEWKNLFQPPPEFEDVVESMHYLNYHHEVLNEDQFGSVSTSKFVIVSYLFLELTVIKFL